MVINYQEDTNTIFLKAARLGNLEKVQDHINNNIDINTSNTVSSLEINNYFIIVSLIHDYDLIKMISLIIN